MITRPNSRAETAATLYMRYSKLSFPTHSFMSMEYSNVSGPSAAIVSKHCSRRDESEPLEFLGLAEKDDVDRGLPLVSEGPLGSSGAAPSPLPLPPELVVEDWEVMEGRWWNRNEDQRFRGLGGSGSTLTSVNW